YLDVHRSQAMALVGVVLQVLGTVFLPRNHYPGTKALLQLPLLMIPAVNQFGYFFRWVCINILSSDTIKLANHSCFKDPLLSILATIDRNADPLLVGAVCLCAIAIQFALTIPGPPAFQEGIQAATR